MINGSVILKLDDWINNQLHQLIIHKTSKSKKLSNLFHGSKI